jgi:hypothetical protein
MARPQDQGIRDEISRSFLIMNDLRCPAEPPAGDAGGIRKTEQLGGVAGAPSAARRRRRRCGRRRQHLVGTGRATSTDPGTWPACSRKSPIRVPVAPLRAMGADPPVAPVSTGGHLPGFAGSGGTDFHVIDVRKLKINENRSSNFEIRTNSKSAGFYSCLWVARLPGVAGAKFFFASSRLCGSILLHLRW